MNSEGYSDKKNIDKTYKEHELVESHNRPHSDEEELSFYSTIIF